MSAAMIPFAPRDADPARVGSGEGLLDVTCSAARAVEIALGTRNVEVSVFLPDRSGRLRRVGAGRRGELTSRAWATLRREVYAAGIASRVELSRRRSVLLLPLVDGGVLGVVEIVARSDRLEGNEEPVTAAVAQTAVLLSSFDRRRFADDTLRAAEAATRVAQRLLRARTPTTAMAAVVDGLWEHGGLTTVGLLPGPEGRWTLVTGPDLSPMESSRLRRAADRASTGGSGARLRRRVALILGPRGSLSFVSAADAFVVTVGASADLRRFQRWSGRLLEECLGRLSAIDEAERRGDQLDLAIACTAHELRNPLLGARAALDHVLRTRGPDGDRMLLQRTRNELRFLEELVEPLLRSFGADEPLSPRPTDLVEVVKEAVTSCSSDRGEPAVRIAAPSHVDVEADPTQLRGAIANVVRNAMEHTPPSGAVSVSVETGDEMARVTVEDEGPGVADGFGDAVFRPFVRGPAPHRRDGEGRGLGLFIARRVVEAHGGSIDLDPSPTSGAAFRIAIPTRGSRRARSAS